MVSWCLEERQQVILHLINQHSLSKHDTELCFAFRGDLIVLLCLLQVQWSPHNETILASSGTDRRLNVWDLRSTTPLVLRSNLSRSGCIVATRNATSAPSFNSPVCFLS